MKQPRTLDEARAAYPSYGFYLIAETGNPVSLDVAPDLAGLTGESIRSYEAPTEAECWALAFPAEAIEPVDPPVTPPTEQMQREAAAANPADTGIPTPIGLFD